MVPRGHRVETSLSCSVFFIIGLNVKLDNLKFNFLEALVKHISVKFRVTEKLSLIDLSNLQIYHALRTHRTQHRKDRL